MIQRLYNTSPASGQMETYDGAPGDTFVDLVTCDAAERFFHIWIAVESEAADIRFIHNGGNSEEFRLNANESIQLDVLCDVVQGKNAVAEANATVRVIAMARTVT